MALFKKCGCGCVCNCGANASKVNSRGSATVVKKASNCSKYHKEDMNNALKIILSCQQGIIQSARADIAELGAESYVKGKISKCFQLAHAYTKAFNVLGVSNVKEFNHVVLHCFSSENVRELYDEYIHNETEWEEILTDLDTALMKLGRSLEVGDMGPVFCPVVNAPSGEDTTLQKLSGGMCALLSKFEDKGWKIIIVSFGAMEGAKKWIEDTHCPFEMVLDEKRQVWNFAYMAYYAEQMSAGKSLPKPYEHVQDDLLQMGGDFLLTNNGVVVMTHPSIKPTDRPSVSDLLGLTSACTRETGV